MIKEWSKKRVSYYKNDKKSGFESIYHNGKLIDGKEYINGEIVYEVEEVESIEK